MGLLGRKKKDLTLGGIPGTALVLTADSTTFWADTNSTHSAERGKGKVVNHLHLEVTPRDGRPPYRIDGEFNVPSTLDPQVDRGVTLPVYVDADDAMHVQIDWARFSERTWRAAIDPTEDA